MADSSRGGADAFARQAWAEAHRLLTAAPLAALDADDLERRAVAAYLTGRDDDAVAALEAAYVRHLDAGRRDEAARCGFWAAFTLMMGGQMAHAGGWLARTEEVIGDEHDCPAAGYVLVPAVLGALDAGNPAAARDLAIKVGDTATRFGDADLAAFATLGHGQALLALGDQAGGIALLDRVMLSVTSGDVGPIVTGIVYCAVILECLQTFDHARAAEWTAALDVWCAAQPDLVPYRGQCLVHQSQLQQASGQWSEARSTVRSACDRLADPPHPALGLACYQQGELHRMAGEFDAAIDDYRRASRAGYEPMPGVALLDLAQGEIDAAAASITRSLLEAAQPYQRPGLLAAAVEIHLAAADLTSAGDAATELADIAAGASSNMLTAMAEHATASVLLASGAAANASEHGRAASAVWLRLRMPYESARTSALLARCCLAVEDSTSAMLHLANARATFDELGAQPDLDMVLALSGEDPDTAVARVLSARELEVLAQVAEGKTNREVAQALSISQHTVGRHLENVSAKLGVKGRAAAIAYAYQHDLL